MDPAARLEPLPAGADNRPGTPSAHDAALSTFERLVLKAARGRAPIGRILLVLGENAEERRLLQRLRHVVARNPIPALFAALALPPQGEADTRWMLRATIDGLRRTEIPPTSGLRRLSEAIGAGLPAAMTAPLRSLSSEDLEREVDLGPMASEVIRRHVDVRDRDHETLRALLAIQRRDPYLVAIAISFLRGELLTRRDRALLGGVTTWTDDHGALIRIERLIAIALAVGAGPLILAVEGLERGADRTATQTFVEAMTTIRAVTDRAPGCVAVVACPASLYERVKESLPASLRDRVERDPEPFRLGESA